VGYKCIRCEDTKFVAGDPKETLSWREVVRRSHMSRSLKVWAEHMPKAECPECKDGVPVEEPDVVKEDPPKKKLGRPRKVW